MSRPLWKRLKKPPVSVPVKGSFVVNSRFVVISVPSLDVSVPVKGSFVVNDELIIIGEEPFLFPSP